MNLLLVNYEYPPLGGGAGNATACLARALHSLGHGTHVVTASYRELSGWSDSAGVQVLRLRSLRTRVDRASLLEMLAYVLRASWAVPRMASRLQLDGCIVFFSMPCGPVGWLSRKITGVPYVVALRGGDVPGTEPGMGLLHRLLAPVRRAVFSSARAVVANSAGLATLSRAADPHPVDVIPNGVDTAFFTPGTSRRGGGGGPVELLFVGRFQPQKNLFLLLRQYRAACDAKAGSMHLTMVGDGPQREALQSEAVRLGISESITWLGWMDKPRLAELYRQADAFINPSTYEGMPNTVLEAMASGLPVIASSVAGNDELVDDGRTGFLFDLAHPDALGEAIQRLAQDEALRISCGNAAREKVVREYSWNAAAKRYADYFSEGNQ